MGRGKPLYGFKRLSFYWRGVLSIGCLGVVVVEKHGQSHRLFLYQSEATGFRLLATRGVEGLLKRWRLPV